MKISIERKMIFLFVIFVISFVSIFFYVRNLFNIVDDGYDQVVSQTKSDTQKKQKMTDVDLKMIRNMAIVKNVAEKYYAQVNSYKGFSFNVIRADNFFTSINEEGCSSQIYLDISPDGKKYIIYYPTCSEGKTSAFCIQNGMEEPILADSSIARKEYRCETLQNMDEYFAEMDKKMFDNTMVIWNYLERYKKEHGSYQGFLVNSIKESGFSTKTDISQCSNEIKTEIFGDGKSYRITYDLCLNDQIICVESGKKWPSYTSKKMLDMRGNDCGL